MQFLKKYEAFSDVELDKNQNFYEVVGSNLPNLILDQQNQILRSYRKQINSRFLNSITKTGIKLRTSEILHILTKDFEQRLNRINSKKTSTDTIKKEFEAYFYFLNYLIVNLQINIQQLLLKEPEEIQMKKGSESYAVFNLTNIQNIAQNINVLWTKLLTSTKVDVKNTTAVKKVVSQFLNVQHQKWTQFFEDDSWRNYQIKKLPQAVVDEQQQENEDLIQKELGEKVKDVLGKVAKVSIPVGLSLTQPFISRFNQQHGADKGINKMKRWFLQMILDAEKSYGKNFKINSGYRSPKYQAELRKNPKYNAAKNSPHVAGVAADISLKGENKQKIIDSLTAAGFNRFGIGKSFLHVDAGDRLNPKTWTPYARWGYGY